jgi:hypothetical protein
MKPTDCSTNTDDTEDFAQEQSGDLVSDIPDRILNAAIRSLLDRPSRTADACEKWRGKGLKQSPNKRYLID